jgi:hypothetical protein
MPNILELCNARLTRVPEEPVEPKITPSGHGTVKKKSSGESTGNAGGTKRSRPLEAGSGVADSSRSMRSSPSFESGDARPTKKRKLERQPSLKPRTQVLKVNPTEFPKEFHDRKDMDPAEEGDYERCFTPFGFMTPDQSLTNKIQQNYQEIIPLPLTLPSNFDYCMVCNEGGKLTACSKCPRAYHSNCLAAAGGGMEDAECHRCNIDCTTLPEEDTDLSNLASNAVIKAAYDNSLEDFAFNEKILELLVEIVNRLKDYDFGDIFAEPVNADQVPNYLDVIKAPMDYGTIIGKLESGRYPTEGFTVFNEEMNATEKIILHALCDIEQVHHNCALFNLNGSCYHRIGRVHATKWKAFYEKHVEDRLPAPVRSNLEEFRAKLKEEIESQIQVRMFAGTNPGNRANVAIGVFDPVTKKVVKQYTSKSAACRAAILLKNAGYACEYDLDEKNVKGIVEKSNKEAGVLLFGYRWIAMDRLRGGKFEDDVILFPAVGNFAVFKVDTATGSRVRGFESEEAAYNDWLEARADAMHLDDESIGDNMASFRQHFLRGNQTINGLAWKLDELAAPEATKVEASSSLNEAIVD